MYTLNSSCKTRPGNNQKNNRDEGATADFWLVSTGFIPVGYDANIMLHRSFASERVRHQRCGAGRALVCIFSAVRIRAPSNSRSLFAARLHSAAQRGKSETKGQRTIAGLETLRSRAVHRRGLITSMQDSGLRGTVDLPEDDEGMRTGNWNRYRRRTRKYQGAGVVPSRVRWIRVALFTHGPYCRRFSNGNCIVPDNRHD
jgi:hypothetical protein